MRRRSLIQVIFLGVILFLALRISKIWILQISETRHSIQYTYGGQLGLVMTYNKDSWMVNETTCEHIDSMKGKKSFMKGTIKTRNNRPISIYLHDTKDYISNTINSGHDMGADEFEVIYKQLMYDKDVDFIDIGSKIGIFALRAAAMGRKVLAMEASYECVQRLCASVEENGFKDNFMIIHNAVTSAHEDVELMMPATGDYGLTFVDKESVRNVVFKKDADHFLKTVKVHIRSVTLNDLIMLPIFNTGFKKVFMKIDIEGMEHEALKAADLFFKYVDVRGIVMEWNKQAGQPTADVIFVKMALWGFSPCVCRSVQSSTGGFPVSCKVAYVSKSQQWPLNILWLQNKYFVDCIPI